MRRYSDACAADDAARSLARYCAVAVAVFFLLIGRILCIS